MRKCGSIHVCWLFVCWLVNEWKFCIQFVCVLTLLPWQRCTGCHAAGWRGRWSLLLPWWQRTRRGRWRLVAGRRGWRRHHTHWRRQQTYKDTKSLNNFFDGWVTTRHRASCRHFFLPLQIILLNSHQAYKHQLLPMGCPWGPGPWPMGGGGGCIQGGGRPLGFGGMGGPPMLGMGGGKLWGPPWPPGPPCMPWKFLFSFGPELIHGGRFCCTHTKTVVSQTFVFNFFTQVDNHVPSTYRWRLVIVGAWGPRCSSLGVGVSSTRCRDWSLPQLSHKGQVLLVHSSLVLGWLRRLTTCWSVGSEGATPTKQKALLALIETTAIMLSA